MIKVGQVRVQSMGRATSWMPCAFKILSIVLVRLIRPLTLVEDQPRLSRLCHPSRQESASEVAHSIKINKSIATENQYCPCNALETIQKCSLHCAHRDIKEQQQNIISKGHEFHFQALKLSNFIAGLGNLSRSNTIHLKSIISLEISAPSQLEHTSK